MIPGPGTGQEVRPRSGGAFGAKVRRRQAGILPEKREGSQGDRNLEGERMIMQSGPWTMTPFNGLYLGVFAFFILLLTAASLLLRHKSERTKKAVLTAACAATLLGFILYKYALWADKDYSSITAAMGGFNWWGELPLQLCNINMLLIPFAVLKKNRPLMSFGFFLGPLGALMAVLMPATGFDGYSLLLPRMLGYYGTHFMVIVEGLALASFGLFRPRLKDLPKAALTALVIALVIFGVNMLLRRTGLHPKANYFYSVETEGNFLLEIFHRWLPFPFLYLLPSFLILAPYMLLVTAPFALAEKRAKKKPEGEENDV